MSFYYIYSTLLIIIIIIIVLSFWFLMGSPLIIIRSPCVVYFCFLFKGSKRDVLRHPDAGKRTWEGLLEMSPNYFSAQFPTRYREKWGKAVYDEFQKIESQLLRSPPVRTGWMNLLANLCGFPA